MSGKYMFVEALHLSDDQCCAACCVQKGGEDCASIDCNCGYLVAVTKPAVVCGKVRATVLRAADGWVDAAFHAYAPDLAFLHDIASQHGGYVQLERLVEGEPGRVLL